MKIDFISQYFYPEQFSNNSLAENLAGRGHDVTVFTAVPNYPAGRFFDGYTNRLKTSEEWGKVHIRRVWTFPRGKGALSLLANYLAYPVAASIRLLRSRSKANVTFVSQLSPVFMVLPGIVQKWRRKTPLVIWVQDIWPQSATYTLGLHNRMIVRLLDSLCGWLYRQADLVLVQSEAFRDTMEGFGVPSDRIRVLPNTAPASYRPLTAGETPEYREVVPQDGFRLMFAGNIGESQDFDTLLETAELLREHDQLKWVIVGSGRDEERVKRLVQDRRLAERFCFLGRHPEEEMPKLFAHADAMLVSLKDIPIFALTVPYKIQCYMACGKPIVASLNGEGARIVADSGAGVAVAAQRPQALAAAIVGMMEADAVQRRSYGLRSRDYFERNYSPEKVYCDLERALRDAAQKTMEMG